LILFAPLLLATADEPAPGAPGGQTIVFFSRAEKRALDEALLLDAVAIYTRDLGLSVVRVEDPPPSFLIPSTTDDAVAVLRARSARLGFWYQVAPDGRSLELFTVDGRKQMTRQPFANEPAPGVDLYRAIALKIRVMVVGAEAPAPPVPLPASSTVGSAPVGSASSAATPPGSPANPASGRADHRGAAAVAAEPVPEPAPSSPSSAGWMILGASYALSLPSGSASWRHAGSLHAMASFHLPLEADLGLELAPSDSRSASTGNLSVMDVPIRVGVRLVRRGPSSVLGLGVIAAVHLLSARVVAPDDTTDRAWTATGAGGLEFVARSGREGGIAPELRLWVEAKVPRTRFMVKGTDPRFDAGLVGVGVSVGLTFARQ
jgi:hypothetical protein